MKRRYLFSRLALATSLSACMFPAVGADLQNVSLQFAGEFAGQTADCSATYENTGVAGNTVGLADFRLYVSRVRLLDANGNETPMALIEHGPWQHDDIALLDFEDGSGNCTNGTVPTNTVVKGQVPAGDYRGVAFDIGIPFESNHQDPTLAASPLNLTALFWNWRGGYRFLRVDLLPETGAMQGKHAMGSGSGKQAMAMKQGGAAKSAHQQGAGSGNHGTAAWALHLGSTGCLAESPTQSPQQCAAPNRVVISFPQADPTTSVFVVDPAMVLAEADVTHNTQGTSPGCMSAPDDPECETVFKALGLSDNNATQSLVSVR